MNPNFGLSSRIRFGPFELDADSGELRKAGTLLKLQPQPFRVLSLLVSRAGQVVGREEIQHALWDGDTFVDFDRGINFCVNQVRAALSDDAERPRYVETVPRRGYRFIAAVTLEVPSAAATPLTAALSAGEPLPMISDSESSKPSERSRIPQALPAQIPARTFREERRNWKRLGAAAIAAGLILAISGFVVRNWLTQSRALSPQRLDLTRLTDSGRVENVAISADGRYVAYAQREATGAALRVREMALGSDIQVLPPEAISFVGLTFSADGNHLYFVRPDDNDPGFKYLYVIPTLGGQSQRLVTDIDTPVSFSPDGRRFVYNRDIPTRYSTEVRIANADGSANRVLATMTDAFADLIEGPTWSPDGRSIAVPFSRFRGKPRFALSTIDVANGSAHELYASPHSIGRAMWLPQGDKMLSVLRDPEGRGQLWTVGFPGGKSYRVTNDLSDYWGNIDLMPNAATLAAIERRIISNIWSVPVTEASSAVQLTSLSVPFYDVAELPNGKLLADGGKLWVVDADGKQRTQFGDRSDVNALIVCGNSVVLSSELNNRSEIVRFDLDGSNPLKLVSGEFGGLACSHDGKSIFYVELGPPQKIFRISMSGGTPIEIAPILGEDAISGLSLSPDGKALLYAYERFDTLKVKLAIVSVSTGRPLSEIDAPGGLYDSNLLVWSPTGKSVDYMLTQQGASNIWEQPLEGGTPRRLTNFNSGQIFNFSWSADRKRLMMCRGEVSSDVVLLRNFH